MQHIALLGASCLFSWRSGPEVALDAGLSAPLFHRPEGGTGYCYLVVWYSCSYAV